MKAYLHSFSEVNDSSLPTHDEATFRKATTNMRGAYTVCEKALKSLTTEEKKSISFLVNTYFGEVSSSLEFLTTLHESNIAKPIVFQNSLHNSTLGFVSIQLGLQGPAITISADEDTDQAIANTVATLLQLTDHVLFCSVDMVPDYLNENYIMAFPQLKPHLGWARTVIFSKTKPTNNKTESLFEVDLGDFNFTNYVKALNPAR